MNAASWPDSHGRFGEYGGRFVPETLPWAHVDVYAWNDSERPGRPRGGEAQGLRAFAAFLAQRYR